MQKLTVALLLALSLCLGGCWRFPFFSRSYDSGTTYTPSSYSNLLLSNGNQAGDMGEIVAFDGAATRHEGYYDSYGANLRLDSEGADWWAMSSIHVTGDLMSDEFAPGTRRVYVSGVADDGSSSNVSVTGCSGPSYGNYTYDTSADSIAIEIEDLGGGTRRMHFETIYTNYDGVVQVTTGSVDYAVADAV